MSRRIKLQGGTQAIPTDIWGAENRGNVLSIIQDGFTDADLTFSADQARKTPIVRVEALDYLTRNGLADVAQMAVELGLVSIH